MPISAATLKWSQVRWAFFLLWLSQSELAHGCDSFSPLVMTPCQHLKHACWECHKPRVLPGLISCLCVVLSTLPTFSCLIVRRQNGRNSCIKLGLLYLNLSGIWILPCSVPEGKPIGYRLTSRGAVMGSLMSFICMETPKLCHWNGIPIKSIADQHEALLCHH